MSQTTGGVTIDVLELVLAQRELETLLGARIRRLDPDSLAASIDHLAWTPLDGWGRRDDASIVVESGLTSASQGEALVVVTDVSFYKGGGAFVFERSELTGFLAWHWREMNERVFSGGDVIAWARESSLVWVFHHEGVFARIDLSGRFTR